MKNSRLIGGVILMLGAAGIFFFNVTDYSTLAAITLLIVGIVLAATARKVRSDSTTRCTPNLKPSPAGLAVVLLAGEIPE